MTTKPADGGRRVFEGYVRVDSYGCYLGNSMEWRDGAGWTGSRQWLSDFDGKRVRITVEIIDDAAAPDAGRDDDFEIGAGHAQRHAAGNDAEPIKTHGELLHDALTQMGFRLPAWADTPPEKRREFEWLAGPKGPARGVTSR